MRFRISARIGAPLLAVALAMLMVVILAPASIITTWIRTSILFARLMEVLFMFLPVRFRSKEFRLSFLSFMSAEKRLFGGIRNRTCLGRRQVKLRLVWTSIVI